VTALLRWRSAFSTWADRYFHVIMPAPAIVALAALMVFPLGYTVWLSVNRWIVSAQSRPSFVGAANYAQLLQDAFFWQAVGRTFLFCGLGLALQVPIGLALALLVHRDFRGRGFARTLLLLPMMATPAAIALVWTMMMEPSLGVLNYVASLVGIAKRAWLADPQLVIPALVIVDTWQWCPLIALFCLAGLAIIPAEPYEAARIDGATGWQQFRYVTLPYLRPILIVAMLFRVIDSLKTFDLIYVMTQGGPGRASETLNLFGFHLAFHYFNMGYASAFLVVFLVLVLGASLLLIALRERRSAVAYVA
jgi:multiple sugar transport system permease protein